MMRPPTHFVIPRAAAGSRHKVPRLTEAIWILRLARRMTKGARRMTDGGAQDDRRGEPQDGAYAPAISFSVRWLGAGSCARYERVNEPVPRAMERSAVAYRISSNAGTSAVTRVRPPGA